MTVNRCLMITLPFWSLWICYFVDELEGRTNVFMSLQYFCILRFQGQTWFLIDNSGCKYLWLLSQFIKQAAAFLDWTRLSRMIAPCFQRRKCFVRLQVSDVTHCPIKINVTVSKTTYYNGTQAKRALVCQWVNVCSLLYHMVLILCPSSECNPKVHGMYVSMQVAINKDSMMIHSCFLGKYLKNV